MASFSDLIKDFNDVDQMMTMARLCESAERFEDMAEIMQKIIVKHKETKTPLTQEQETLMSVAFKNIVGDLRKAYRKIELESAPEFPELHDQYNLRIIEKVKSQCQVVIDLLNNNLMDDDFVKQHTTSWETFLKENSCSEEFQKVAEAQRAGALQAKFKSDFDEAKTQQLESQAYYLKMLGDYWRYLSEAAPTEESQEQAHKSYEDAWLIAKSFMAPTHPTRLGLALNSSVFVQEIRKNTVRAQEIAGEAFNSAIAALDTLNDASYKDSTLIMQLLRDNLTIWQQQSEAEKDLKDKEMD